LETRSLLQALYYVSHGIDIPPEHASRGLVTVTHDDVGRVFDWSQLTNGLFRVRHAAGGERPPQAHVAIPYLGYWFYIDRTDQDPRPTSPLLMELARLDLTGRSGRGRVLPLRVGGR